MFLNVQEGSLRSEENHEESIRVKQVIKGQKRFRKVADVFRKFNKFLKVD